MSAKPTIAHGETIETESDEEMTDQALSSQASAANQQLLKRLGGIIACSEDGSSNYKQYIADYLDKKFPPVKMPES